VDTTQGLLSIAAESSLLLARDREVMEEIEERLLSEGVFDQDRTEDEFDALVLDIRGRSVRMYYESALDYYQHRLKVIDFATSFEARSIEVLEKGDFIALKLAEHLRAVQVDKFYAFIVPRIKEHVAAETRFLFPDDDFHN